MKTLEKIEIYKKGLRGCRHTRRELMKEINLAKKNNETVPVEMIERLKETEQLIKASEYLIKRDSKK